MIIMNCLFQSPAFLSSHPLCDSARAEVRRHSNPSIMTPPPVHKHVFVQFWYTALSSPLSVGLTGIQCLAISTGRSNQPKSPCLAQSTLPVKPYVLKGRVSRFKYICHSCYAFPMHSHGRQPFQPRILPLPRDWALTVFFRMGTYSDN